MKEKVKFNVIEKNKTTKINDISNFIKILVDRLIVNEINKEH